MIENKLLKLLIVLFLSCIVLLIVFFVAESIDTSKAEEASVPKANSEIIVSFHSDIETPSCSVVVEEPTIEETKWQPDEESVIAIAKTLYGECRGVKSKARQAAVAWCILNRVDARGYGSTPLDVVSAPHQFAGYNVNNPVTDELRELAVDVLTRWHLEKEGQSNVGRTLPKTYLYFIGDGKENHFTEVWRSKQYWDWSLEDPYLNS